MIAGTAALLAVAAVLALAIGTHPAARRRGGRRRHRGDRPALPAHRGRAHPAAGAAGWLLRVTPAAAFAVQQTLIQYPQVSNIYTPLSGYYPLAPWAGFAVLCAWAALALALAAFLLGRRDA